MTWWLEILTCELHDIFMITNYIDIDTIIALISDFSMIILIRIDSSFFTFLYIISNLKNWDIVQCFLDISFMRVWCYFLKRCNVNTEHLDSQRLTLHSQQACLGINNKKIFDKRRILLESPRLGLKLLFVFKIDTKTFKSV